MNREIQQIKKILYELEYSKNIEKKENLLDQIINISQSLKYDIYASKTEINNKLDIKLEKIGKEPFLYKPVLTKNYYEGTYLERFAEARTMNLKDCGVLDKHNKFWQAHEVMGSNVFATIPRALISQEQADKLQALGWYMAVVDIYEVKQNNISKTEINNYLSDLLPYYILLREVYGDIIMALHYNI